MQFTRLQSLYFYVKKFNDSDHAECTKVRAYVTVLRLSVVSGGKMSV